MFLLLFVIKNKQKLYCKTMQKLGLLLFAWIELIKAGMFRYSRYRRERRSMLSRVASKGVKLTKNEKKEIEHLYNSYFKTDGVAHTFYKQVTGVFDAYYLPDYIYYCYVDPFYNDWTLAKKVDNKCYYPFLFSDSISIYKHKISP